MGLVDILDTEREREREPACIIFILEIYKLLALINSKNILYKTVYLEVYIIEQIIIDLCFEIFNMECVLFRLIIVFYL